MEDRRQRTRASVLVYVALGLLTLLTAVSLWGAFVTGPNDRDEIRDTANEAETLSAALAKSNAGVTALICTGANRHDSIDRSIISTLDLDGSLASEIPPATNCGELICQFFREVDEPGAEITIDDPFGPDRKLAPCGTAEQVRP